MDVIKRRFLFALAACSTLINSKVIFAQNNSTQVTRLIVPFTAGGAVDQVARAMSQTLARELGETIIVENKPGASGSLAASEVAISKNDGRTLMLVLDSHAVNNLIIKNLPYDSLKSFDNLSLLVSLPQVLLVKSNVSVKSFDELIEYIKKKPNASYGSAGSATAGHINSAQLSLAKNLTSTHIPYKGAAPLMTDLLGGHIDYAFAGLSVALPYIKSGALRAIAVSSPQRSEELPDIPAMKEFISGFEFPTWIGISSTYGMALDRRNKLISAVNNVMNDPEVKNRLKKMGFDIVNSTSIDFNLRMKKDVEVMKDLVTRKIVQAD